MESEMSFVEFTEKMREEVSKQSGREFEIDTAIRNNSVVCVRLIVAEKKQLTPSMSVEGFYEKYKAGFSITQLARDFISIYMQAEDDCVDTSFLNELKDYDYVKDKVCYRLINFENNIGLLSDIPYEKFLNLAKIYYVEAKTSNGIVGTILIDNSKFEMWGISKTTLSLDAENNTKRKYSPVITSMYDVMKDQLSKEDLEIMEDIKEANELLYELTNNEAYFGAAVMCYDGVLEDFANEIGADICILPCSVDKVMLAPLHYNDIKGMYEKIFGYKFTVCNMNRDVVRREDVLADNVYVYSRETGKIEIY